MTEDASSATGQVRVYWQRWWILALFSLFTMEQCAIWNTFGPIAQSAEKVDEEHDGWIQVFDWSDSTIAMFTLWGCLDYAIWFLPSALLLSRSLRYSVVTFHLRNIDKQIPNPSQGGRIVLHASRCLSPMSAPSSSFHRVFLHKSLPCRSTISFHSFLSYFFDQVLS